MISFVGISSAVLSSVLRYAMACTCVLIVCITHHESCSAQEEVEFYELLDQIASQQG